MKVKLNMDQCVLNLSFSLDPEEGPDRLGVSQIGLHHCKIHLPKDWNMDRVHPDLLALAIILIIYPFTRERLELPFGVSQSFHDVFKQETKKSILPIDSTLKPRTAPANAIPALAFSGGVDSTAALTILPDDTACFFLDRILPAELQGITKLYNKEAVYTAYAELDRRGRQNFKVPTDLEYVRNPRGFPLEISTTIPALLLADDVGIDSIATGILLETLIMEWDRIFNERMYATNWFPIFAAVDVHLNHVTRGISEIGTMKIVSHSPNHTLAQWCMRPHHMQPCLNCDKCFRKYLLQKIVLRETIPISLLDRLFRIVEAKTMLKKFPIHYENVLTYITSHYHGNHQLMNLLKKRTRGDILETDWMEKWYPPAKEQMYSKYFEQVKENIMKYLDPMDSEDEKNMLQWDIRDVTESEYYQKLHEAFVSELLRF